MSTPAANNKNSPNRFLRLAISIALAGSATLSSTVFASEDAGGIPTIDGVTVIGVTSLPGAEVSPDQLAGNIQSTSGANLEQLHTLDVTDYLTRAMGSVFSNDAQGNPLQRDLQVRGFVVSPLLGLSQGISVYQDGVRVNEPFGDTVNWALIPDNAIAAIDLLPGSNPMFGLNTLGGALVLRTKSGFSDSGVQGEVLYGSNERITIEGSAGTSANNNAYFISATQASENGWRDYSRTRVTQVFADARHRVDKNEMSLSLTYANTDLIGNGPAPDSLLRVNRHAIFTRPDRTQNTAWLLSLGGQFQLTGDTKVVARAYERHSDIDTLNGDDSDFKECALIPGFVCLPDEDDIAVDQNGDPILFGNTVDGATVNRSETSQVGRGIALQWVQTTQLFGQSNHLVLGVSMDRGESKFESSTELGELDATRQAVGSGYYVDDAEVELQTDGDNRSVFLVNTYNVSERTALTISGRYYEQKIALRDQLGTELNGEHRFSRFNPSLGVTTKLAASTLYASYSQSTRAPSPVELTCANPDDPCRLPNAFLSDPALDQVIATTIEAGLRGTWAHGRWHLGAFRTDNRDDILFVSAGELTNQGYFANVDLTRRQGIELKLAGSTASNRLHWFINYTWLDATFGNDLKIASANNPRAINGVIAVEDGDRLPGIPEHLAKLGFDYNSGNWSLETDVQFASTQFARGDEANLLDPLASYFVVNTQASYALGDKATLTGGIHNLLNREYATFAVLGESDDVLNTGLANERFSSPSAPRSYWIALRVKL